MKPDEILRERGQQYGETWLAVGQMMRQYNVGQTPLFTQSNFGHNWVQIVGKCWRALQSPFNIDHWVDVRNYAQLVIDYLSSDQGGVE